MSTRFVIIISNEFLDNEIFDEKLGEIFEDESKGDDDHFHVHFNPGQSCARFSVEFFREFPKKNSA